MLRLGLLVCLLGYAACYVALPSPRIVGGAEAEAHSHPWQASLQYRSKTTSPYSHICGASIISEYWLVTAAHCVDGSTTTQLAIVVAEHDLDVRQNEVLHTIAKIIKHASYRSTGAGFPNDIALIKLNTPIALTDKANTIRVPPSTMSFDGNTNCYITGWGLTQGPQDRTMLQELPADVRTQAECRAAWGTSYINSGHICVENGDTGACNGDSGGPLACYVSGTWYLAGCTSWGYSGCTTRGYPSVYTRVSYFSTWISTQIAAN